MRTLIAALFLSLAFALRADITATGTIVDDDAPIGSESALCQSGANTLYVGPSATGNGSGSDYNNLLAWSFTPVRGKIYCLVDGTYASKTLSTAESGATTITITKATVANHGTSTGWLDTMGDGAATWSGNDVEFTTGYWVFDGGKGGGPGSWKTGHGFAFTSAAGAVGEFVGFSTEPGGLSNLHFSHISCTQTGNPEATGGQQDCFGQTEADSIINDAVFEYNYANNLGGLMWFMRHGSGNIFQYNYSDNVCGMYVFNTTTGHCEVIVIDGMDDVHFRWNYLAESPSSGGFVANNDETANLVRIYGNVFSNGGPIACNTQNCTNWRVFNNTFHHAVNPVSDAAPAGSGNLFYNNIHVHFDEMSFMWPDSGEGTHDYNWFSNCAGLRCTMGKNTNENICQGCAGGCDSVTETATPFVNDAGDEPEDWQLTSAISGNPGTNVCSLDDCAGEDRYNEDAFGNTRGTDGTWDRGAFEFN